MATFKYLITNGRFKGNTEPLRKVLGEEAPGAFHERPTDLYAAYPTTMVALKGQHQWEAERVIIGGTRVDGYVFCGYVDTDDGKTPLIFAGCRSYTVGEALDHWEAGYHDESRALVRKIVQMAVDRPSGISERTISEPGSSPDSTLTKSQLQRFIREANDRFCDSGIQAAIANLIRNPDERVTVEELWTRLRQWGNDGVAGAGAIVMGWHRGSEIDCPTCAWREKHRDDTRCPADLRDKVVEFLKRQ